jgi:hypothetical protein
MKSRAWVLSLLLLAACGEPPVNYVQKIHWQPLVEADLYNKNLAYDVAFDAEEQELDSLRVLSSQLFLQGAEALKNKNQPNEAVRLLKESILALPSARSYYELGNALMKIPKGQEEALKAYEVAEHLQFQPQTNLYYNMALAHAGLAKTKQQDNQYQVQHYLQQAIHKGFADTVQLYKEPMFREALQSAYFRDFMLRRKVEQLKDKPDAMFSLFRRSFPLALQPYEVPLEKVDMKDHARSISYDFARFIPEMQNANFGRDVSHEFFYVAKVAETGSYTALLYSSVGFISEAMQPVLTKLVTYNNQGKQISSLVFSCQCSAEKVKKGRIENNLITLEEYKRVWKHPIHKVSFEENAVLNHELLSTATFRIDDNGKILEESVSEEYKDANLIASQK